MIDTSGIPFRHKSKMLLFNRLEVIWQVCNTHTHNTVRLWEDPNSCVTLTGDLSSSTIELGPEKLKLCLFFFTEPCSVAQANQWSLCSLDLHDPHCKL